MQDPTQCPKCASENIYSDRDLWICPECSHEWSTTVTSGSVAPSSVDDGLVRDAHGNILADGDSVVVIKDLKIKGASSTLKNGTKAKNIRLTDAGDGHNISCRIDSFGTINLKSEFVKKA